MTTTQRKRIQIARSTLLLDQPFFGMLALGLELIEDSKCDTAWTNGQALGYSPAFVDTLSDDELCAVIAHEVMHCACGHPWRRGGRDHELWNVAADYAINGVLREAHFQLPAGALLDAQFNGKASEWIYDRLPQRPPQPKGGQGSADPSRMGEVRDAPTEADAPTAADWQQSVKQAVNASRGQLPASLQRDITAATQPRVDWRSLLRRYISEVAKSDYSWTRPNVRYLPLGLFLPSLHTHVMGKLAVAIDTSGSIDNVLLAQFAAEIRSIADEVRPSCIEVLYCDARVQRVERFELGEPFTLNAKGGGGTAFGPVFTRLQEDEAPVCLVYLTDLQGSFPPDAPDYPVIWACTQPGGIAPFGDVVPCE